MKYPGQQNLRFQEKNIQKTIFLEKFLFWDPWVLKFKELSFTPSDDVHTPLECSQRSKQQTSLCYWRNRHVCTISESHSNMLTGLCLCMGLCQMPRNHPYWENETSCPIVAGSHFQTLLACRHFTHNLWGEMGLCSYGLIQSSLNLHKKSWKTQTSEGGN